MRQRRYSISYIYFEKQVRGKNVAGRMHNYAKNRVYP